MRIVHAPTVLALLLGPVAAQGQSLYEESTYTDLAADHRAQQVGDSLTILIVESAQAESATDQRTDKSTGFGASASVNDEDHSAEFSVNGEYENGGEVVRTGNLVGRVTVTVQEVSPSGRMHVHGRQSIRINNEEQLIVIEGDVRPEDVRSDNMVFSSRIANADITYDGDGPLGREKRPGVILRVINWMF